MQTVFVTADVHGHFKILKDTLTKKGFDPDNPDHHLLVLGDFFDRGEESLEVYEYLKHLHDEGKASLILGNHDLFMLEFLEGKDERTAFNVIHNGFDKTLESFTGKPVKKIQRDFSQYRKIVNEVAPDLYEFLDGLPLYIEHENVIFTHGGIDFSNPEWKKTPRETLVWNYQNQLTPPKDKTVVVGHDRTALIRLRHAQARELDENDDTLFKPIYENNAIYIDSFVEFSKRLNVLTFTFERPL
ncbi:MAG: metallophosphoesterase [Bacillota bacterium]